MQKIHDPECKVISFIVDAYNSSHIIIGRRSPKSNESSYNLNLNHLRTQEGPLRDPDVKQDEPEDGFQSLQTKSESNKGTGKVIFFTIRSIVNRDSIAKFYLLTIEYAIQIMFKCARTNHKDSVAVVFLDFLKVLRFPVPVPVEGTLKISCPREKS